MVPPVFIPRPETEELVELILQQCDDKITIRFAEIGCGTGAISLALLHSLPKVRILLIFLDEITLFNLITPVQMDITSFWHLCVKFLSISLSLRQAQCIAIDQSEYACKLTLENATNLELSNRIKVYKHKLADDSEVPEIEGKLDLIVSNPPYIPTNDLKALAPEISLYEDLRALDGGPDGLNIIKTILKFSSKRLCLRGHLWLEVDPSHPPLIQQYLDQHKDLNLKFIANYKDMFEKERFVEIMKV